MLVSSPSALGIKTCLYKAFLTAEGTKCSPERKELELFHLPSPLLCDKTMSPKGAGSWPLAGGRKSTAVRTKGANPDSQLLGAV
jgi:hypothetical protein